MRRKILWSVLGLLVLAGAWWWLRPSALDRLDVLVAELRARGEAVTMEELEPPPVPDEQNGAAEIDAALAWLDEHLEPGWKEEIVGPWSSNVVLPYMQTSTPEELDALRAFLEDIAPFYERVDRAVTRRVIRWPLSPLDPVSGMRGATDVPRLQRLHRLLEPRARASDGSGDGLAAVVTKLRLTQRWQPRIAIEWLVLWTQDAQAIAWLRDGVEARVIDPIAARELLDDLLRRDPIAAMPDLLRAERTWSVEIVPHVVDGSLEAAAGVRRYSTWKRLEKAAESLVEGKPLPYAAFQAHAMVTDIERLSRAVDVEPSWEPAYAQELEGLLGESSSWAWQRKLLDVAGKTKAAQDLARLALAACEVRRETGRWPTTLVELGPLLGGVIEQNPYSGGRYVLQVQGDALTLSGIRPGTPIDSARDRGALGWFLLPDVIDDR